MISVLLADDQSLVRTGFRMILENAADMRVVGEAGDGAQAARLAARTAARRRADGRPDARGRRRRRDPSHLRRRSRLPAPGSSSSPPSTSTSTSTPRLQAGASGFLLKDTLAPDLLSAIRVVARGDAVVAPTVTRRLLDRYVGTGAGPVTSTADLDVLTEREREVLGLIARGLSNGEIAGRLYLAEGTVKTHVSRVLAKLGLRDRVQAVVYAYECGLVRAGAAGQH